MSDNKNFDDEYQYIEEGDNQPTSTEEEPVVEDEYSEKVNSIIQKPNVRRNALIAVVSLFVLIGLLKCTSSANLKRKEAEMERANTPNLNASIVPSQQVSKPQQPQLTAPETQAQTTPISQPNFAAGMAQNNAANVELEQVQNNQRNMQSSLANLGEQVNQLNTQVSTMMANNQTLQQQLSEMQNKESALIGSIDRLIASQKVHHYHEPNYDRPRYRAENIPLRYRVHFYVQAIIPGRAWLINSQGHTYTVRVGSRVPGFGVVEKIDPWQGRVVMSSGKILRFNQDI